MSEKLVCDRCGYAGPMDAQYCARCGHALVPPSARPAGGIGRILGRLSSLHIALLGIVLMVSTSALAAHLMVTGLNFHGSLAILVLVLGCGCAVLGWQWNPSASSQSRVTQMLLVFASLGILVAVVWLIDRAWLSFLTASGNQVVYAIPGVTVEASAEGRRLVMVDVPPYWLAVTVYAAVTATVGNLIHRVRGRWGK